MYGAQRIMDFRIYGFVGENAGPVGDLWILLGKARTSWYHVYGCNMLVT